MKTDYRDNRECAADGCRPGEPVSRQKEGPGTLEKSVRAATALVVFVIPAVTLTAALVGCGIRALYKRLTGGQ